MPYQIAGIDVHKKMLAVVVADVEVEGDYHFERLKVGTSPAPLHGGRRGVVAQRASPATSIRTALLIETTRGSD